MGNNYQLQTTQLISQESLIEAIPIPKIEITKEDISSLLNEYDPLNDQVLVILRKPVTIDNNSVYYGEWTHDRKYKHGRGIIVKDNITYKGYWINDKINKYGKFIYRNGDKYEGEVYFGMKHGKGKFESRQYEFIYEGLWENDDINGFGVKTSMFNGSEQQGVFVQGKLEGQ